MDPGSFDGPSVGSELERFILSHAALKPGDKLEGKVIQVKPGGKVLIHFGNFRAVAETAFPIKEGESIHVVVVSRRPKLELRLETPHLKPSPGARSIIRKLEMLPQDRWDNIRSVLEKLLDLQGDLLFPTGIREALRESEKKVKLKIYSPGEENEKGTRLSLLPDTERLGKIRVDFHLVTGLQKKKLNITFFVKDDGVKEDIELQLAEVRANLEKRFRHLVLNVIVSERKIAEFDTEDMDATLTGIKMLDVKV